MGVCDLDLDIGGFPVFQNGRRVTLFTLDIGLCLLRGGPLFCVCVFQNGRHVALFTVRLRLSVSKWPPCIDL